MIFLVFLAIILGGILTVFRGDSFGIQSISRHEIEIAEGDQRFYITGTRFTYLTQVTLRTPEIIPISLKRIIQSEGSIEVTISRKQVSSLLSGLAEPQAKTVSVCISEDREEKCLDSALVISFVPEPYSN